MAAIVEKGALWSREKANKEERAQKQKWKNEEDDRDKMRCDA